MIQTVEHAIASAPSEFHRKSEETKRKSWMRDDYKPLGHVLEGALVIWAATTAAQKEGGLGYET